jgi:hypothetical protein
MEWEKFIKGTTLQSLLTVAHPSLTQEAPQQTLRPGYDARPHFSLWKIAGKKIGTGATE